MALISVSTSATLAFLNRKANQWGRAFPIGLGKVGNNPSWNAGAQRRALHSIASGMLGHVGVSESDMARQSYKWREKLKPRVCILGGGFGGLYTALRLESLEWMEGKKPQVVLVDQSERFVFKPMMYELLSGEVDEWEVAPRFSDLLENTSVHFFQDKVKLLHPNDQVGLNVPKSSMGGTVFLESGLAIEYDWLVLALGAEAKLDTVPGAADYAFPFYTLEDVHKIENKLRTLERKCFSKDEIRVVVVGCGYAGVELAATIAERLHNKGTVKAINVETTICPTAPPGNRESALKILQSRNVQLLLGYFVNCIRKATASDVAEKEMDSEVCLHNTVVSDVETFWLDLQPSESGLPSQILEADLILWTVGTKPSLPQLQECEVPHYIPINARGQAETDETLRVKGHPRIFAVGDSSTTRDSSGRLLPATAQVALQQADFAGWNLWAAINDRPLLPFRFQNLGEMITLGRNDAAISPTFIDGLTLEGPLGHTARKIAYLLRLPTDEHRVKVGMSWLTKFAVDSLATLHSSVTKLFSHSS